MPDAISINVNQVLQTIQDAAHRVGRDPKDIHLVAATKTVSAERMRDAHHAGICILGENRLQEAQEKKQELRDLTTVSWHFIGQVQRRKIKEVVGNFSLIHSLESLAQAREMDRRAKALQLSQPVLLQVNISGETTKGGFAVSALKEALPELNEMSYLLINGLMTIPPAGEDVESARPYFQELRELAKTIDHHGYENISMYELSMGMSQDYPIAIEEGATLVRVGSALFGPRKRVAS